MITQLAVEAAFRGAPICDLIRDLTTGILQAHARKETAPVPSWVAEAEPEAVKLGSELWCKRNTQTELARLRCSVAQYERFFSSACHLGLDARFGVQDVLVCPLRSGPP